MLELSWSRVGKLFLRVGCVFFFCVFGLFFAGFRVGIV